ncbi:hypothetical protein POM88_054777 [Heracleum sosnowskyi]|uniref:Uncharacterized protein n=1 Tax=Heracleum sosnowskyi TaxID=360622 RepID=A0AAD8GMD7_9APIA|nr:hypothetical protein POM88_054777 [Heracleum sosnowskyi]
MHLFNLFSCQRPNAGYDKNACSDYLKHKTILVMHWMRSLTSRMHKTQQGIYAIHMYMYVALFHTQRDSTQYQESPMLMLSQPSNAPFIRKNAAMGNPMYSITRFKAPRAYTFVERTLKSRFSGLAIKHIGTVRRAPISAVAKFMTDIRQHT